MTKRLLHYLPVRTVLQNSILEVTKLVDYESSILKELSITNNDRIKVVHFILGRILKKTNHWVY